MIKQKHQLLQAIIASEIPPLQVENVGQFVSEDPYPPPPAWITSFFGSALGDNRRLITSSAKGAFLVPIADGARKVNFVISFGTGGTFSERGWWRNVLA